MHQMSDESLLEDITTQWNTCLGRVDSDLGCRCIVETGRLHLPDFTFQPEIVRFVSSSKSSKKSRFLTGDKVVNVRLLSIKITKYCFAIKLTWQCTTALHSNLIF